MHGRIDRHSFCCCGRHFLREPLPPTTARNQNGIHPLIISAFSSFGPTAEIPEAVFSRLYGSENDQLERWSQSIAYPLGFSLTQFGNNFSDDTLDRIDSLCEAVKVSSYPPGDVSKFLEAIAYVQKSVAFARFQRVRDQLTYHSVKINDDSVTTADEAHKIMNQQDELPLPFEFGWRVDNPPGSLSVFYLLDPGVSKEHFEAAASPDPQLIESLLEWALRASGPPSAIAIAGRQVPVVARISYINHQPLVDWQRVWYI